MGLAGGRSSSNKSSLSESFYKRITEGPWGGISDEEGGGRSRT